MGCGSSAFFFMELAALARALEGLGCPPEKCHEMAAQLDKRASQLAEQENQSYEEAMTRLLSLMRQGWAAQGRGL
jgi:pyrroline-5-carboxylate reductase